MKDIVSAFLVTVILVGTLVMAFDIGLVKASGTIYIRADGSIDPPTSPISSVDNATYFLIGNITSDANGIVVQRDNIIIDGAGYTIQGTGVYPFYLYNGIFLTKGNNVTTKNTRIENFYFGIYLNYSSYISIVGNNITNNDNGIYLDSSSNNLVCENYITNNDIGGIRLVYSDDNTLNGNNVTNNAEGISIIYSPHNSLANNTLAGNDRNFGVLGETEDDFLQNIETSNSVEGKTIYYWINQTAQVVPLNAGYVAVVGSRDIRVEGLNMSHNLQDILLAYSVNSTVEDNKLADSLYGVSLVGGGTNKVANNSIVNSDYGVGLRYSSHNNLSGNTFSEDTRGMLLIYSSNNNSITQNIFTEGSIGIDLVSADFNSISQNNFTGNQQGILIDSSFDNMIYHNSFVDNSHQVYVYSQSACIWDSGYPSGGNYWSDYTGIDQKSGSYQNESGSDGMGDTPYVIDADNRDNYPLMNPWPSGWKLDFTAPTNHPIVDFAVYNGSLYAAADNKLYVKEGSIWSPIDAPTFVTSLEPYGDKLVVGGQGGLYCYDGTSFSQIFSVPTYIKVLGAYNNTLYAGTMLDNPPKLHYCNGSADNPSDWHVGTDFSAILGFSGAFGSIDSFAVYGDVMYLGSGGKLYSFNGASWSIAASYDDVYAFLDMQVYNDKLYLATRDQGWRKPLYEGGTGFSGRVIEFDGENWTTVLDHDYWIYSLGVYDDKLYAGTANKILTCNGTSWETSFSATEGAYYAISMINYDGKVYAGMGNGYIFVDPVPPKTNPETVTVPEFPVATVLTVFMALTMLATAIIKKKRTRAS